MPVDYAPMQDLSIDIKTMPQAFGGYHLLLVITCNQTNFMIAVPLRDRTAQTVAEALIYIYLDHLDKLFLMRLWNFHQPSYKLYFACSIADLTSLSFPKIDTIPVKHREYYNLLLARAQLVGNMLLEWRTKQALEYKNKVKKFRNEEIFQDNQMVYLLAPHASALQTNTMKFKQDFIGPLFIDTALDKTRYRLEDATGLLLDGTYHVNRIKKGSACTPLGIVDKFDTYETALENTLLNKFAIETPNNKLQEVTLQDGSKELNYLPGTIVDYAALHS